MNVTRRQRRLSGPETRVLEAYKYLQRVSPDTPPSFRLIAARAKVSPRVIPDYLRRAVSGSCKY